MNTIAIALLSAHQTEIARLRAAGDHRAADALQAAVNAWLERMERADGRRDSK